MKHVMRILKAEDLGPKYSVVTPQHGSGVLLVHEIVEVEPIDWGNHIEITAGDQRKHIVNADDLLLVVF